MQTEIKMEMVTEIEMGGGTPRQRWGEQHTCPTLAKFLELSGVGYHVCAFVGSGSLSRVMERRRGAVRVCILAHTARATKF